MLTAEGSGCTIAASGGPAIRLRFSPKRRAQMKLQGRYMGYLRSLGPKQKAQVRKVRESKGMKAAISRARRLALA
jgi:hypothetical protein